MYLYSAACKHWYFSFPSWQCRKGWREEPAAQVPSTPTGWEAPTPTATRTLKPGAPSGGEPTLTPAHWADAVRLSRLSTMTLLRPRDTWSILERQGQRFPPPCPACPRWLDRWVSTAQTTSWRVCWITWTCCRPKLPRWVRSPCILRMSLCFRASPTAPPVWPCTPSRTTASACTARWGWTPCPRLLCRRYQRPSRALRLMRTSISTRPASSKSSWPQMQKPAETWGSRWIQRCHRLAWQVVWCPLTAARVTWGATTAWRWWIRRRVTRFLTQTHRLYIATLL